MKNKPKLLIIDDQENTLNWYASIFHKDFLCITEENGDSALNIFNLESPQIVLCDVKLSDAISGFDICRKIKSISPQTIVILASSYNSTINRVRGFESRADDYIDKIMNEKELVLRVKNSFHTKNNTPAFFPKEENKIMVNTCSFETRVKNIIFNHYKKSLSDKKKSISLSDLAVEMHRSPRSIQREFTNISDCNFSLFHKKVRLKIACDLLLDKYNSIGFISEYLCYASPSIFSREFKSIYKVTPSKYRLNAIKYK